MNRQASKVDYKRCEKVTLTSQIMIALGVFITEVINNTLLYLARSHGYGPDTIVEKLIRYLLITTIVNFGLILVSQLLIRLDRKEEDETYRRGVLMIATILICTNVAYTHYQFAVTLAIFIVPVMIGIMYEDIPFSKFTFIASMLGLALPVIARASDPFYNKEIGPEAAIAYCFLICEYLFARVIMKTLSMRRTELGNAMADAEKVAAAEEITQHSLKTFETLARALDAKDKYTNGHAERVAFYSILLAKELGFDCEEIEKLRYDALLHDIGKIGVPDAVLNKPDRLTDVEFSIIKSHTVVGDNILKEMSDAPVARDVAMHHHERYDGKGYPEGLKGEEISVNARIVCIADTYDAMSSDRIYRKALSREIIRQELVKGRGTQFDPHMLDVFLALFDNHKLIVKLEKTDDATNSHIQTYVRDDIDSVLYTLSKHGSGQNFENIELYLRNIGLRYKQDIDIVYFTLVKKAGDTDEIPVSEGVSEVMERCAKKCIGTLDIYFGYSELEHCVILLNIKETLAEVIAQRIMFEFAESEYRKMYDIEYKIREKKNNEE